MTTDTTTDKAAIIAALARWIRQRPGLDFGNYGDTKAYRAELRSIARDKQDAVALLRYVEISQITGEQLAHAFRHAFSGRLQWDGQRLDYTTGQYWPTEYRRAACAVLASALWAYWRDDVTGDNQGDQLRARAHRVFGRGMASRWFR